MATTKTALEAKQAARDALKVKMKPGGIYKLSRREGSGTEYAIVVAMEEAENGDRGGTLYGYREVPLRCKESDDAFQGLEYVGSLSDVMASLEGLTERVAALEGILEKAKAAKAAKAPKASARKPATKKKPEAAE